jgi:hypothetical protein
VFTTNAQSEIEVRFGRNEHSEAHGPAWAAEEISITGAASRPTSKRDMSGRMMVFS